MPNEIPLFICFFRMSRTINKWNSGTNFGKHRKIKPFSVPKEKNVTKIGKDSNEIVIAMSYKITFIDSARFIASSLSNLVDNLTEEISKVKCKDCFLEYESVKDNLIKYKCLFCNKDYSNKIDEELQKRFKNTFKFFNNNINKFILLLRKAIYL